jgi:hypothetical protein
MASVQFEANNPRNHFIRHRAFLGELTRMDAIADDFNFRIVRRPAAATGCSRSTRRSSASPASPTPTTPAPCRFAR